MNVLFAISRKTTSLLLLIVVCTATLSAQQDSLKKDARYKFITDPCSPVYRHSVKLLEVINDSVITFSSDSGVLYMEKWLSALPLKAYSNYFDSKDTRYSTDSCFALLFRTNLLTCDNIIQALKTDRKAVSQYGDTLDMSARYAGGPVNIFRLNTCPVPKYIKDGSLCFDIGFVQANAWELRYHFKLVLYVPGKFRKANLYIQIKNSALKCLLYQGFEI